MVLRVTAEWVRVTAEWVRVSAEWVRVSMARSSRVDLIIYYNSYYMSRWMYMSSNKRNKRIRDK